MYSNYAQPWDLQMFSAPALIYLSHHTNGQGLMGVIGKQYAEGIRRRKADINNGRR